MRREIVTGHGADDATLFVQHHVEEEVDADDAPGLVDVLAHRVAVEGPGAGRVGKHHGMVGANGVVRADAGHHRLGATREAGEVVVVDIAGADTQISLDVGAEDDERRAAARRTHGDTLLDVQVNEAYAAHRNFLAD